MKTKIKTKLFDKIPFSVGVCRLSARAGGTYSKYNRLRSILNRFGNRIEKIVIYKL